MGGPEDFDPRAKPGPPRPATYDPGKHRLAAVALRAAADRAPRELNCADLAVAGGDVVQIICLADVMEWLQGLAVAVEAGEPL